MQTSAVQACVILERLSDPLHNKSSPTRCGLSSPPFHSPPPPSSLHLPAPKAKHLFLADGKVEQRWLNKYILACNSRFWKDCLEGEKRALRREEGGHKRIVNREGGCGQQRNLPWGKAWKKSKRTYLGLGGCLAACLVLSHTQITVPTGVCC